MSNGKVRIYELSRELNLENKDILTICEQLDIAVKSHSSTITSGDADRIRSAADRIPSSTSVKPVKNPTNKRPKAPHKPEIVGFKPQSPRSSSSSPPAISPKPQPPIARPTQESLEPPVRENPQPPSQPSESTQVTTVKPPEEIQPPSDSPPTQKSTPPVEENDEDGVLLLAPPVRPTAKPPIARSGETTGQPAPSVNRPVIKPQKSDRSTSESSDPPQEKAPVQTTPKPEKRLKVSRSATCRQLTQRR